MNILDNILDNAGVHDNGPKVLSENHDLNTINWEAALRDPAEMVKIAASQGKSVEEMMKEAALRRASLAVVNGKVNAWQAGNGAQSANWHGLGLVYQENMKLDDIRKLHPEQFWTPVKKNLFEEINGKVVECEDIFAIYRSDNNVRLSKGLGGRYQIVTNEDGFETLDKVIPDVAGKFVSGVDLFNGEQFVITIELPNQKFTIGGNDENVAYLSAFLFHDGTGAVKFVPHSKRVVCNNTKRIALGEGKNKGVNVRHTGNIPQKLYAARKALQQCVHGFELEKEYSLEMANAKLEPGQYFNDVLDQVMDVTQAQITAGFDVLAATLELTQSARDAAEKKFKREEKMRGRILEDILTRYENRNNGVNGMRGTAWSAYNAVTEHADHSNIGHRDRNKDNQRNAASKLFLDQILDSRDDMKQIAWNTALNAMVV